MYACKYVRIYVYIYICTYLHKYVSIVCAHPFSSYTFLSFLIIFFIFPLSLSLSLTFFPFLLPLFLYFLSFFFPTSLRIHSVTKRFRLSHVVRHCHHPSNDRLSSHTDYLMIEKDWG